MSEERLQEIKDSISLQYKVQEANNLNKFNIFTDEEKELVDEIERLNNIIIELSEKNRNLLEDNMRLRKELNLHSGKLYISDIEVKEVWK